MLLAVNKTLKYRVLAMKTILIVMISFAIDGGAASTTVEFKNRTLCEAAKMEVVREIKSESNRDWGRRNYIAVCVDG